MDLFSQKNRFFIVKYHSKEDSLQHGRFNEMDCSFFYIH